MPRFAAEHCLTGGYDGRVEQHLGCSPTRCVQALAGLPDRPEALAAEPELVDRLRALRERRQSPSHARARVTVSRVGGPSSDRFSDRG